MKYPKRLKPGQWGSTNRSSKPKVITFDAYNTLYSTTLPVMEQYSRLGRKYGLNSSAQELTLKFPGVFKNLREEHPNYGKYTGITADKWWEILISNVFAPAKVSSQMINEILHVFEGFGAYTVYPDLLELLELIQQEFPEVVLGVVSNTDPIMYKLLENIGLKSYFKNHVYLSYDLELSKPDPVFFEIVLQDVVKQHPELLKNSTIEELKSGCWHVGDEENNDLNCPASAGWSAVLLDRMNKYNHFSGTLERAQRSLHQLYTDKIDNNADQSWELSMKQVDAIQLSERQYVISNFRTLSQLLFPRPNNQQSLN
ncbi:LAQU0S07e01816g1_1 [Lachancea quebecensis]|uniref:LAQU0S07e01816g1_1 n=1 Tax=Lachancea quebecensis TaxID=1654605 RepID=A0A0P1KSW5_9SACH|nr:LAQU0S07e01816g1_1 [Lachancea quebecensis]